MPRRTTAVSAPVAHLVGPGQLKVTNNYLAFKPYGDGPLRLDPTVLTDVYCYGDVSVSGAALDLLFRHGVQTAWLSPAGAKCRGRLTRSDAATTITRVRQHRVFADPTHRRDWATICVAGKIEAMAVAARHYQRHGVATAGPLIESLRETASKLDAAATADVVRGLEGAASAAWFGFLGTLFAAPWSFTTRTRRPPTDPVNALLSLGYTWLLNRTNARAEAQGFEINVGGFHEYHPGRPSLGCDLIEPFRVPVVDRWVVATCAQGAVQPRDFKAEESGGFRLQSGAFARTLSLWEQHVTDIGLERQLDDALRSLGRFLIDRDAEPDRPVAADL